MQQAISAYYAALQRYDGLDVTHETAVRSAMQNLLGEAGREVGWTLVSEYRLPSGKTPDGTFLDNFRLRHGYWEAKDPATTSKPKSKKSSISAIRPTTSCSRTRAAPFSFRAAPIAPSST